MDSFIIEKAIEDLKLPPADLYVFGDGSGTTIQKACAWATVSYDTHKKQFAMLTGSYSKGTNNMAELMAYVQAFQHYMYISSEAYPNAHRIEVISDSELIVMQGRQQYARTMNAMMWAQVDQFQTYGYKIGWTHVRRNTNPVNTYCDGVAGRLRKLQESFIP